MQVRIERPQFLQEFEVPLLLQAGVQSANHVHLGDPLPKRLLNGADDFLDRLLECVGVAFLGCECTELAGKDTNIRVINIAVVDVGRVVAVLLFANRRGQYAEGVQVGAPVKR